MKHVLISLLAALCLLMASSASAQLRVDPITWNVIGLDHNKPLIEGPDVFPTAIRVTNIGVTDATNVTCTFAFTTSSNPGGANIVCGLLGGSTYNSTEYIFLDTPVNTFSTPLIAAGDSYEFWFNLRICRNASAYTKRREFRFSVTSTENPTPITHPPALQRREFYVEGLRSQARNDVTGLTGPSEVFVGETYDFLMLNSTATGGYEQLTTWSNFPPQIFEYLSIEFRSNNPTNFVGPNVYANACNWQDNPDLANYLACLGTGKVGNVNSVRSRVRPRASGVANIDNLIYDKSGASFHYNADLGGNVRILDSINPCRVEGIAWLDNNFNQTYDPGIDSLIPGVRIVVTGAGPDGLWGTPDDVTNRRLPGADGVLTTPDDTFQTLDPRTNNSGYYGENPLRPGRWRATSDLSTVPPGYVEYPNGGSFRGTKEVNLGPGELGIMNFGFFDQTLDVDLVYFRALAYDGNQTVRLVWETADEIDNVGFNIYRGERTRSDEWTRGELINSEVIGAVGAAAFYEYSDPLPIKDQSDIRAYYLEDISAGGGTTIRGPFLLEWNAVLANVETWARY